jgi:hypothetical protein
MAGAGNTGSGRWVGSQDHDTTMMSFCRSVESKKARRDDGDERRMDERAEGEKIDGFPRE